MRALRLGLALSATTVLAVTFAAFAVRAGAGEDKLAGGESHIVHISIHDASKWKSGPAPGVEMIPLRGDSHVGAHATFIKFPPGADHGWHTHTNEQRIVVLQGEYLFKDEHGKEIRVKAGDYFCVPAGLRHWSGTDSKEGCIFFSSSPGKFDLKPIEKP